MLRSNQAKYSRHANSSALAETGGRFTPYVVARHQVFAYAPPSKGVNFAEVGAVRIQTANLAEV